MAGDLKHGMKVTKPAGQPHSASAVIPARVYYGSQRVLLKTDYYLVLHFERLTSWKEVTLNSTAMITLIL